MTHRPDRLISRQIFVAAPASEIFNLLADSARHGEIDGSGTIQSANVSNQRLALGATFGMSMKMGVPYKISNKVVEFEEGRRIAWQHFGGHTWRYILEPTDGGTIVTEEFDGNTAKSQIPLVLTGAYKKNAASIERTLSNLAAKFA